MLYIAFPGNGLRPRQCHSILDHPLHILAGPKPEWKV